MIVDSLKTLLSDLVVFTTKIQFYHWNVTGANFVEHHEFFGKLYEEVSGSIDVVAELIRTQDAYAPGTLGRFLELTSLNESDVIPSATSMLGTLLSDNAKILNQLNQAYNIAEEERKLGISNYLQDRIQAHEKHEWMLGAYLK